MNRFALLATLAALLAATSAAAAAPLACAPYTGPALSALNHYEGITHEHSSYSDGDPNTIPDDYYRIAAQNGYSFLAGSEHSDSLDAGNFISLHASCDPSSGRFDPAALEYCFLNPSADKLTKWNATLAQAQTRSTGSFAAIRGFEWTSDVFGHINVYFSKNFTNAKSDLGFALTMQTFWDWFTRDANTPGDAGSASSPVPFGGGGDGLAHFNHPHDKCLTDDDPSGSTNGKCDWDDYTLIPAAIERMFGMEVYNDSNRNDRYQPWFARALDKGWRLSPVGSEDDHFAKYGVETSPKTVTLATGISDNAFKAAWLARRTYALSPGKHLRVAFAAEGHPMGSQLSCTVGATVPMQVAVTESTGAPSSGSLRLYTNGGVEVSRINAAQGTFQVPVLQGRHWYFVRAHGADGQSTAYVAPVWIDGGSAPAGNWLRGDTHVHTDHSPDGSALRQGADGRGPGTVSVADQIGQGVLNGLSWMPITDHRTYTQHYDPLWESPDLLLIPGEEANGSPHSTVHGAVDWLVQGAARPDGKGYDRLQTSIWDAHAQGANWSIAHPDDGEVNADLTPNALASAIGMNVIETWNRGSGVEKEVNYAENRWNQGHRFGMVGASDNHFRELWATAGPGLPATGVFAAAQNERSILQGLQNARTRVALDAEASAPAASLEADFNSDGIYESLCGDEVVAPTGTAVKLRLRVANALGTTVLLYKSPGRAAGAFKTYMPTANNFEALENVAVEASPTWYRVEVRGNGQPSGVDTSTPGQVQDGQVPVIGPDQLRAVCSPIFVSNAPVSPTPDSAALSLPVDSGKDDGAKPVLGDVGQFAGFPDVAVANGVQHVVAETHSAAATHIFYRRVNADGSQGDAIDLVPASSAARFPAIAAKGQDVWVTWADERAGQLPRRSAIYLRHSSDGGATWLPEVLVRSIAGRAERPDVALLPDGKPVLVWQEIAAGNPFDVMAQVIGTDSAPINLSRAGKTIAAATPDDTRSARYPASVWPSVAVADDGRMAVAFHDDRSDPDPLWTGATGTGDSTDVEYWQVLVASRAPGANAWSALVALGANDRADRHANLAFSEDGALIAVWDDVSLNSSGTNLLIRSARSTDGGASFAPSVVIAADPVGMGQYPRLGRDPNGAVRVVWYDSRSSDWRWRVMTAVNDATGNWMDVKMLPSKGINTWPATDGGAIVFASTRNAARLQRDATQQIVLLSPSVSSSAPAPFTFILRENVALNRYITSEPVTLSGFSGLLDVRISSGGQYSIDGRPFTNTPGKIAAGARLVVRHISAKDEKSAQTSVVTVGSYSTEFVSVTTTFDRVPDAFGFATQTDLAANTMATSNAIVLHAFNTGIPIVPGPGVEYRLGGVGEWTRSKGRLSNAPGSTDASQTIEVRHTTKDAALGYAKTYIKVGGVTGYFVTRTR